jgi:DNA polymerase-3 subunit beta
MQITIRKSDLVRELQLIQGIVERKNSIPILSNVLAEAKDGELHIAATDLDVSLRTVCPVEVKKPGSLTLAAKKLYEIARSLPDSNVSLVAEEQGWARIVCEDVSFRVAGLPRDDFPALPEAKPGKGVEIPGEALRALIARTQFAITTEDARYYLAGALLLLEKDSVSMVATDGHRLAFAQRKVPIAVAQSRRVLVPRKAIVELGQLLDEADAAVLHEAENHLLFQVGSRLLSSKLIEGQFPAFEKVIEATGDKVISLNRERFAAAIRRVSLLSSERSRSVKVAVADGSLEISASSPDLGEAREKIAIDYEGEAVEIGFNAQYLIDFLGVVGTDTVLLELRDGDSQGILKPAGDTDTDFRYVVMPMRF